MKKRLSTKTRIKRPNNFEIIADCHHGSGPELESIHLSGAAAGSRINTRLDWMDIGLWWESHCRLVYEKEDI